MKNQLYMLAVLDGKDNNNLPLWEITASSQEYDRILVQYNHTHNERLLLDWNIMSGVRIVRANLGGCQMSSDFNNIDVPLDKISNHHRAGLYLRVFNTVVDFLKD